MFVYVYLFINITKYITKYNNVQMYSNFAEKTFLNNFPKPKIQNKYIPIIFTKTIQ